MDDVPALIEQSVAWCGNINTSMAGVDRRLDGFSELLDGLDARLDVIGQEGEASVATAELAFTNLESVLDQLESSLKTAMETSGGQVKNAETQAGKSMGALSTATTTLKNKNGTIVSENQVRHQNQVTETDTLKGQLSGLLTVLQTATTATVKNVGDTHLKVDGKHGAVKDARVAMDTGFTTFGTGVKTHSTNLQAALTAATTLSSSQLLALQTDLQKQLDTAMEEVRRLLEANSKSVNSNTDDIERFLDTILSYLVTSRTTMDNTLRPPTEMVGNILDALQPIINLLGLLEEVGLL